MTLSQYLSQHGFSAARFAERIGVSAEAVRRYISGERTPRPAIMHRIMAATGSAVTPNDFHNPPTEPDRDAA